MTRLIDADLLVMELTREMDRISNEACERRALDPDNGGWSYTIRDAATVNTLQVVINAIKQASKHAEDM